MPAGNDTNAPTTTAPRPLQPNETPSDIARTGYDANAQQYLDWAATLNSPRMVWLDKLFTYLTTTNTDTGTDVPNPPTNNTEARPATTTRGLKILELGCGAGIPTTLHIAQTTGSVVGLDISQSQIELAHQHFAAAGVAVDDLAIQLRAQDILEADFATGTFDGICAFYSIIHLAVRDQEVLLRRCFRWLRPGGWMVFNVGTEESREGAVVEGWLGMKAYWASPGKEGMEGMLRGLGFEVVEIGREKVEGDADFTWFVVRRGL